MGRKKQYDRDELVALAVKLFHAHGFAGTSTQMLVEHLGVNRNSMYAEFGSKQALFDAVLARYEADVVSAIFSPLEAKGATLEAIDALFEWCGAITARSAGWGCMMCNTAVELHGEDPSGEGFVSRYFTRAQAAFRRALEGASRSGALSSSVDVSDEAAFLTVAFLGIFVLHRARADPAVVKASTRVARRHVASLHPAAGRKAGSARS